jgi:hypothetical protein
MRKAKAIQSVLLLTFMGAALLGSLRSGQSAELTQEPSREGLEFYEKKIRPLFADHCFACHSEKSKKPQGGLLVDSLEAMLKGGAGGPAITPGDPEKSLLINAVRYSDSKLQMPPAGKLEPAQIKDLETWVKMGTPAPKGSPVAAAAPAYNFDEAKKFWSFQPVRDFSPPPVKRRAWVRSPIDQFLLAKLEAKQLTPVPDASRRALIRRASFDLTGLPPTPEEVDAFVADKSHTAFEKVIDRLLASSAYGEKWGRHWLDVVRYADTAGDNSDYPVTAAFRYRNYVIDAFNKDKPYDQFIREQLAGDILARHQAPRVDGKLPEEEEDEVEIPGVKRMTADELEKLRQERIIATGYLAMSRRFGSRNREMNLTIDDTIDNLGKTFLGLSTACARCHDHKFDPIPQRDYYALYGIFNSSRYSFPGAEIYPHPSEMVALTAGRSAENFYKQQKELSELDDAIERMKTERGVATRNKKMKDAESAASASREGNGHNETHESLNSQKPTPEKREPTSLAADYDRDTNNSRQAQASKRMPEEVAAEWAKAHARQTELHHRYLNAPKAYAVVEGHPANAKLHRKGDPKNQGDEIPRGFLTILGGRQLPADFKGSGRDLLAGWIADRQNPLTARVMVNRIWAYHFGKGIVATPNDFGLRGKAPMHPELLDWLAARFIESGWSIKTMHKMIMLSHAYQLSSADHAKNAAVDVNNDYHWRFDRRRLEAEEIRDAMLAVSGRLARTMGAEHPFPPEPTWRFSQHVQFFATYETDRRSVYVMQQRLKKHPFFEVFDGADTNATTDGRAQSITPVQALFLMNSPFVQDQSEAFAVRVGMAHDLLADRVDYAFRLAYGRAAKPEEVREAQAYLQQTRLELKAAGVPEEQLNRKALASYLRALLGSNEFLYVD